MILGGFPEQIWRSRPKRAAFLLLAFLALATMVPPPPEPAPAGPAMAMLRFAPVPLDAGDPARRRLGRSLSRRLGAQQRQPALRRHLRAPRRGRRGDRAQRRRHLVPLRAAGRAGREPVRIVPLPSGPGPATRKSQPRHRIDGDRRRLALGRVRAAQHDLALPPRRPRRHRFGPARPMRRWRANSGPEAMARLADGRFLVFGEGPTTATRPATRCCSTAIRREPGTRASLLHYRRVPGYRVTDATLAARRAAADPQPPLRLARRLFAGGDDRRRRRFARRRDDRAPRGRAAGAAADDRQYGRGERDGRERPDDRLDRLGRQFIPAAAHPAAEVRFGRSESTSSWLEPGSMNTDCASSRHVLTFSRRGIRGVSALRRRRSPPASSRSRASGGGP